ncbi:flavin reductase family protein [Actinocorallia aurea]
MDGFDEFARGFDPPALIVTAASGGERAGCLVGFATQCSMEPVRYLVCLSRANRTFLVASSSARLAVHALRAGDAEHLALARLFAESTGDETDKFAHCAWTEDPGGVPLLTAPARRMVGRILDRVDLGDHVGFLLAPETAEADDATPPLGLAALPPLSPGHPPSG